MKRILRRSFYSILLLLGLVLNHLSAHAQALTGTRTIPGNYATISSAVAALNANGVGSGGVTFNIAAGYTETLTAPIVLTATGTLANPIVFQKSGAGANPRITAFVGTQNAFLNTGIDVMWSLLGSDYVTISQVDLQESAANTSANTMMETGYGLYKANGGNGCNNNTIQNCTITLNRNNIFINGASGARSLAGGSVGIEMLACTPTAIGTTITVLSAAGASSNNRFYGNTIQNCNFGISLSGFAAPAPYTLGDSNNDIGGTSTLTGNNILNFGGGTGAFSQCGAVLINSQWGSKIQYNTINNNTGAGVNHPVSNRGIWLFNSSPGASCDINFNKLTIKGDGAIGGSTINWMIDVEMAQSGANGNTINVNNNQFLNCAYLTTTSGAFAAVWLNTAATNVNVNNNYIYGYSYAGTSTNPNALVLSQLAGIANLNVNNNIMDSTTLTGGSGTFYAIGISAATTVGVNINNNSITRFSLNTLLSGTQTINGIFNGGVSPVVNVLDNTVNNITRNGGVGGNTVGININSGTLQTVKRNTVSNMSISGLGATSLIYGITTAGTTVVCDSNTVFNLAVNKVTGTGLVQGINNTGIPATDSYSYNTVYNLTSLGTGAVTGIAVPGTNAIRNVSYNTVYNIVGLGSIFGISQTGTGLPRMFNNKIYDLTTNGSTSVVSGIAVSSSGTGTSQIFNNVIGRLFAPVSNGGTTATVIGINITSIAATSTIGLYNNTINLAATSTGANFSSSGIFHTYSATATTATLDMRNNIVVNNSLATGTGITSAFRRSASTDLNNFNTISNRNLFYAGVPSASNVIYYDGTNLDQTLSAYQTRVLPRDSASFSEAVNFVSNIGSSTSFLKISPSILTAIEGNARNIAGITNDFENNIRAGNVGYTGTSGAPDLGAFEGNYLGSSTYQMFLDSSIADQRFGIVTSGSTNAAAVRVRVHTQRGFNPLTVTSFRLNTAGTSAVSDVLNARVFYTGSDSTFTTPVLFGTALAPNGAFTVTGNRTLAAGINYFWVTYDLSATAVNNNLLDARVDSIVVNGVNTSLLVNDPAGSRTIRTRLNGNYNVGLGQTYTKINDAIADLTSVGVSGPVTFILTDVLYNTASGETFPLTISGYPGASGTNRVTIRPNTGVASRIEANNATAVVDLNGVRFFTIDGRQGGTGGFTSGNNLVITNLGTAAPAVRFINEASQNSLLYVDVRGGSTTTLAVSSGVINIATTTGLNGNDSNTIKYCDIHEEGVNLPIVGVSSIGTATTLATNNDGNIIDSCNIYNTFSATFGYAGVYVGANNNAWRITANRFYQTATRTSTSTQTHRAIWVTPNTANLTSASGFVINNNFIGGAASNGTGVTTLAGTTAYLFNGMDISVGLGAVTSIQNNTITNINMTTASTGSNAFVGINLANGNVDCGTVAGNVIGSRTTNGAIAFTLVTSTTGGGAMGIRTGGGTNNTFNIANNNISGFDLTGNATTISPEFFGINASNGAFVNVTNNMIGDTLLPNSINITSISATSGLAQRVSGIFSNPSVAGHIYTITNNTIANINNNSSATGSSLSATRGIFVGPTANGTTAVNGNLIRNISSAIQTTGSGFSAGLAGIAVSATAGNISVAQNRISGITSTSSSTSAAVIISGIAFSSATTGLNEVKNNVIHGLSLAALNPVATMNGIDLVAGNGLVYNNIIRLGIDTLGNAIATPLSIRGVSKGSGSNSIYHNSVYIGGSAVGSSSNRTIAFLRTASGIDDVRNNIFSNMRVNGSSGGGHIAVSLNNNTTLILDNNIYNFNTATDTLGVINNVGYTTLSSWKNNANEDFLSAVGNPNFVNATGSSSVLNMRLTGTTPAESFAAPVGVTTDFEGDARNANTPDNGADEGTYVASDLASPNIVVTALANDTITGNRIVTATITDATGVYRTGALQPRIYFRKYITGTLFSTQGAFVSGTSANGNWNFTINSTLMGGITAGDSVYYFVVAQDSSAANNLGSFPAGVEGANVNTLTVNPILNLNYRVIPRINGVFTVGVGQPYTTLTGANGLFNFINTSFITNNITIQVVSDIEEPGTVALNQLNQGPGTFRVSIVPDAATLRNITGTTTALGAGLITLNGADRVKIDGSFGGSGRFLRFMNRSKIGITITLTNDADLDTIANAIIEGVDTIPNLTTGYGTIMFQTAAAGGTGNDSNVITNCIIRDTLGTSGPAALSPSNRPDKGIFSLGTANFTNDFNTVSNCQIFNFRSNAFAGVTNSGDFWTIYNNSIYNLDDSLAAPTGAQWIYFATGNGQIVRRNSLGGKAPDRSGVACQINNLSSQNNIISLFSVGTLVPSIVDSNIISNIAHLNTGGGSFYCLRASGAVIVRNNTLGGGQNAWDTLSGTNVFSPIIVSGNGVSVVEVSNNTIGNLYNRNVASGNTNAAIFGSQGNFIIKNNTIRDFFFNSTAALSMAANTGAPIGIFVSPAANELDTIQGNTITNMNAVLGNKAIGILLSTSATNNIYVGQNRISNIIAANPALKNASAIGIATQTLAGTNSIVNNQITLGANTTHRVYGIHNGQTAGTNSYSNNTILITGQGDSTSYGIFNGGIGGFVNATNNLVYNKRVNVAGSTARHAAFGGVSNIANTTLNYNLSIVNDTALIFDSVNVSKGWAAMNSLYTTTYNTNWAERTSVVLAENLFTDTTNGNLGIITSNPEAWYANGKGIRIVGQTGDYNAPSGRRSGSIATGAVDIGSVEFATPSSVPPSAFADKLPAGNDSTQFFFGSRMVAKARWNAGGFFPATVDVKYYSGINPPNTSAGRTFMNAYWNITQTGGSGFTYSLSLMQDSAVLGTTGAVANLRLARYSGTGSIWTNFTTTTPDNLVGMMTTPIGSSNVGIFTGTDITNSPLPVKLTSFTAAVSDREDVLVSWSTASETNNIGFDIERSLDGKTFEFVGFVKGAGNSSTQLLYSLVDQSAFAKANANVLYYRLKQMDANGEYVYSNTVTVDRDAAANNGLSVYPNPFNAEYKVSFVSNNIGTTTIQMFDIQGKMVCEQTTHSVKGINTITVDKTTNLHNGIYFVKVIVDGETQVMKMVKN